MVTKQISPQALQVLGSLDVEVSEGGYAIARITHSLDRKLYNEVNAVLEKLGGIWDRRKKGHVFDSGDGLEDRISVVCATGQIVDMKKLLQFYPTPAPLADELVRLAGIKPGHTVLEPSAGDGALIHAILRIYPQPLEQQIRIHAVDLNEAHYAALTPLMDDGRIVSLVCGDFLAMQEGPFKSQFDRIIMNPPFRAQQDAKHVRHAYSLLKPGGRLVSVMSAAVKFRNTEHYQWVLSLASRIIDNPPGIFKEAGTDVSTCIVVMEA